MTELAPAIHEAIGWHLRLPGLADAEWPAFIAWLEAAPANRAAYEEVVAADALAGEGLGRARAAAAPAEPANDAGTGDHRLSPLRRPAARWFAGTIAASLALVSAWALWPHGDGFEVERTAAGMTKQLALVDGTRIDLNGGSALALDPADTRSARLDEGQARFAVNHAGKPFTVQAGGFAIQDLGTVFDVQLSDERLEVGVSEGKVLFDPGGANLALGPGDQVVVDRARNVVVKRQNVRLGDWRNGEFTFDNVPLSEVVAAVHRRYGTDITLANGLSGVSFTGNIRLSGNAAADVAHLAELIGAGCRREGQGWIIGAGDSAR